MALYFVGADKAALQAAMASAGAVAPTVRLCRSTHPEIQAEAADVLKVLARSATAAQVIVDLGKPSFKLVFHARPFFAHNHHSYRNPTAGADHDMRLQHSS